MWCGVIVGDTLHDMTDRPPREQIALRLNASQLAKVREMATRETDSNVSLMLRKLIGEALDHRGAGAGQR